MVAQVVVLATPALLQSCRKLVLTTLLEPSTNKPVLQTQIKICGDGSVMEALFTKSQTLFPMGLQSYLHIADYIIVLG